MFSIKKKLLVAGAILAFAGSASAVPVTYLGADDGVSSLAQMVNSQSALSDFLAVTGPLNVFDFESPIPADLTVTGGFFNAGPNGTCGALCGFNTTSAGSGFQQLNGGSVTFSFANPLDAFGFYVNGLQTNAVGQQTIEYVDGFGFTQSINFPDAINGGGAFVGFVDFGQQISSITFNASNDILGFDDLRFGRSESDPSGEGSVPVPGTLALLAIGMLGLGVGAKRKRKN